MKTRSWTWLLKAISCSLPSGIFRRYQKLIFFNHLGISSPSEPIIIIIIINIIIIIIIIIFIISLFLVDKKIQIYNDENMLT